MDEVTQEVETLETQISQATVKEHELAAVSALIEEKARLAEQKQQLKKSCKEEKQRLQEQLEKMQAKREAIEQEEHAAVMREIEAKYEKENDKVVEKKKELAEHNMSVTSLQRKIEMCPSNIELNQFTKRLVELFDNFNFKSEENRKYYAQYNTVLEIQKLFGSQLTYMSEIKKLYTEAKSKKEREVLLHNLRNILLAIQKKFDLSQTKLDNARNEYKDCQVQFDSCIMSEKEHFARIREFEEQCELNDRLREAVQK